MKLIFKVSIICIIILLFAGLYYYAEKGELDFSLFFPDSYNLKITNVSNSDNCLFFGNAVNSCDKIEIEITNISETDLEFLLDSTGIVYSDGTQNGAYTQNAFSGKRLSKECYGFDFKSNFILLPTAKRTINLCVPKINFEKNPMLFLKVISDYESYNILTGDIEGGDVKEFKSSLNEFNS